MSPRPWPWTAPDASLTASRSQAGRKRQSVGAEAEKIVAHRLRALGLFMVEKINVEKRMFGKRVVYAKKVSGDFRAILPPLGQSVLVELKHRDANTLAASDLAPHQRAALDEHQRCGGLSLLVWARGVDVVVMRWEAARPMLSRRGASLAWAMSIEPGTVAHPSADLLAIKHPLCQSQWVLDASSRRIPQQSINR